MSGLCIVVSLDAAFDCYEMSKRDASKAPLSYYDRTSNKFVIIKGKIKSFGITFINSYELCSKLIDEYLNQPEMKEYKASFMKNSRGFKHKIVDFLWFFEHIDGCKDFNKFEILRVTEELKKWCKINKLDYLETEIYRVR